MASLREIQAPFGFVSEMQNRVSTKLLDKVAGLVYVLGSVSTPIYNAGQSAEDTREVLIDVMQPDFQVEFFFFYPEPWNGSKHW